MNVIIRNYTFKEIFEQTLSGLTTLKGHYWLKDTWQSSKNLPVFGAENISIGTIANIYNKEI